MKFRKGFALNVQCPDGEIFRRAQEVGQKILDLISEECKPAEHVEGMAGLDCTTATLATIGAFHTVMAAAAQVFDDRQYEQLQEQVERYHELLCEHHPVAERAASEAVKS